MIDIRTLLAAIPLLPLGAAVLIALLGATKSSLGSKAHYLTIAGIGGSFLCSLMLLFNVAGDQAAIDDMIGFEQVETYWTWATVDDALTTDDGTFDFAIDISLRADALTAIMLSMVTFVATLVAIYASGYMHGDSGYWRFFAYVSLFVFSMTMLVSVSNFLLLYVFWEAVGVCSYLLIGFWYEKPEASAAGMKAFLVNRVGDFGFAIALFLIWITYGTLNFHDVGEVQGVLGQMRLESGAYVGGGLATAICLLLLVGACGKSAQFPLHVWLPDAMEGPTPVSALIHAATMVTAGIYMVTRCMPLFVASPDALMVVSLVGGFTALLAGLIALTQNDLKRVLAYSTISQLGYMFLALGTGIMVGVVGGMFHLFTHAFFKALLFLGAGSVMHAMGNVIDMRRFGGLRKVMPITCATFAIGSLALAGIVPFSGFWSKDMIVSSVHEKALELHHELEHRHEAEGHGAGGHAHEATSTAGTIQLASYAGGSSEDSHAYADWSESKLHTYATIYHWLYYAALFTALLTAFYTARAFFMTFYGEKQIPPQAHGHAHESPSNMTVPLIVLAVAALGIGGVLGCTMFGWQHSFGAFLMHAPSLAYTNVPGPGPHAFHWEVAMLSTGIALAGVGLAAFLYLGDHFEISKLHSWLEFRGLERLAGYRWAENFRRQQWVRSLNAGASKIGLAWLLALIGYVLMGIGLLLSIPLMIGFYLSPYRLSERKFYFDEIYYALFVAPLKALAAIAYWFDRWVIDGLVNLVGRVPPLVGSLMRSLQMGLIQFYALAMVLSVLILLAIQVLLAGG